MDDEDYDDEEERGDYDDYGDCDDDEERDEAYLAYAWEQGLEDLDAEAWNLYMGADHLAWIDLDKTSFDAEHEWPAPTGEVDDSEDEPFCEAWHDDWGEDGLTEGGTKPSAFIVPRANARQTKIYDWLVASSLVEAIPGKPNEFEVTTRDLVKLADGTFVGPVGWLVDEGFRPGLLVHGHQVSHRNRKGTATVLAVVFTKRSVVNAPF